MARYTLLQLVQKVLSSVEGDEVNSISDTTEALMVANTIEDVFYNLVTNETIPENEEITKLEGLSDTNYPNFLRIPDGKVRITDVQYNVATTSSPEIQYKRITYIKPKDFINHVSTRISTDSNVEVVLEKKSGIPLMIYNDKQPDYYTSFDDEYLVFDSYLSSEDDTLKASKTLAVVQVSPEFVIDDDFIPDIDDNLFPILLNEAKAWVFNEQKQATHARAERYARKQTTKYQSQRNRIEEANYHCGPDYGRK